MRSAQRFSHDRRRKRNPAVRLWQRIRRLFRKDPPEDPYSYVMARTKPRPPYLSATAVADLPED
jgi:hypothetical protein